MPTTTKKDHEVRAMIKITKVVSDKSITTDWKADDLKTTWLRRAKHLGVDGYSAHLRDTFVNANK